MRNGAILKALTIMSTCALASTSAGAGGAPDKSMSACRSDYNRFCPSYSVGTPELKDCMTKAGKRKALTPSCFRALVDDGLVPRRYLKN